MARLMAMLCIMVLSTATGMLCMDLATLATDMEDMVRCTLDTRDMAMPRNCILLEGLDMLLKASLLDSSTKMPGILVMDLRMSPTLPATRPTRSSVATLISTTRGGRL